MGAYDIAALSHATTRAPNDAKRWLALGVALREQARLDEASQALLRAVRLKPSSAEASFQLGITLDLLGELEGAGTCLQRACELDPKRFEALRRLAFLCVRRGRPAEAVGWYLRALELRPRSIELTLELAAVQRALGDVLAAVAQYRRALELDPRLTDVRLELGNALYQLGQLDDAIETYRALTLERPDWGLAHANLGNALKDVGLPGDAIACYRRALALAPDDVVTHGNLLYVLSYDPECTEVALHAEARRFGELHTAGLHAQRLPHPNERRVERKLRVGYVSSDFREHVSSFYLEPLLRAHDREAFEIYCYSNVFPPDAWSARYRGHSTVFRDIWPLDDAAAAQLMRDDRIDVLVDLTMHSSRARPLLFARKPAPVQLSWLAYVGTTGNLAMDYRLTDPHLDSQAAQTLPYTERSWWLPNAFWCFAPLVQSLPVGPLPASQNGYVTFGCLASFSKVNEPTLRSWARVLGAVKDSKLLLHVPLGTARQRVRATLEAAGVAAAAVELLPHQKRSDYLRAYSKIDVCLDALPYNSLTNTLDAAWLGVPTVTAVGETVVGRAGLSVAMNLGLPQLVARTPEQFVDAAVQLVTDLSALAELRAGLRARLEGSPLMDAPRFARDLEAAFRGMWREWCAAAPGA